MLAVTHPIRRLAGVLVCAFLGTIAAPAFAQPSGYIVNASDPTGDGSHDNLWRVDLSTGETTRIGPLNIPNASNPQSDVEGLALESDTFLYGVDDATDALLLIGIDTGNGQPLDRPNDNLRLSLGGSALDPGLSFDCSGRLLMSSATRRTLYRLNATTGQATIIGGEGSLGVQIGDIAVRGSNVYGIGIRGDEGLYRIDVEHGTATLVGRFGVEIALAGAGMDFDRSGNLWAVGHIVVDDEPQPARILRIDPATGAATLGPTTKVGVKSLAITPTRCPSDPPPTGGEPDATAVPVDSPAALLALAGLMLAFAWRMRHRFARTR